MKGLAMRIAAIAALCCLGFGAVAWAMPGDKLFAREDGVAVRHDPRPDAAVAMRLEPGRMLVELKRRGAWVKVGVYRIGASGEATGFIGAEGWVPGALVGPAPPGDGRRTVARRPSVAPPEPGAARDGAAAERPSLAVAPVAATEFMLTFARPILATFRARCRIVTPAGKIIRRKLRGTMPARFRIPARAVSCTAFSLPSGRLSVTLRAADGRRVRGHALINPRAAVPTFRVWSANFRKHFRQARRRAAQERRRQRVRDPDAG